MSQWPMVKLGDVCTFSSGGTPNRKKPEFYSGAIPWISSADIDENGNISTRRYITDEAIQKSSAIVVPQGTLLLVTRTGVGKVAVSQYEVSFSQDITAIEINDQNIDKDYLVQTIRHFAAPRLLSKARGATILGVKRNDVANLEIPFPPLEEQRRIAEILKQSSQQISNARQKLDHLLMISLNTMDAHFTAEAVAGDRGWSQIGDFVISTQYGTSKKANEPQGIPVLRMGNITYEGELDLKDLKYVELDELERKKFNLKNGDILFNRTNSPELVGKTTVYDSQSEMTFAGYLVRARTSEDAHPEYISGFLNSSYGKAYLRNQAKSIVGMANINAKEFLKIPIPSANESEQGVFSSLYIHCRSQINLVRKKITLLEELHQSLATRAFAGQL